MEKEPLATDFNLTLEEDFYEPIELLPAGQAGICKIFERPSSCYK